MSIDLADDECIHGMYPASSCSMCNGREARERAEREAAPSTFPARYTGQCPECDLPINLGDLIAWKDGNGRATHADCWPVRGEQ